MAFPDVPRVIYKKTPSEDVISQVRFPAILRIDTEPPAAFQERIRGNYPFYKNPPALKLPEGMPAEFAAMLAPFGVQTAHHFTSRDKQWTVTLTRDFLALTCRPYDRWENFRDHLNGPIAALRDIYAPAFFTRIGLRYRDVIRRSTLGLKNVEWTDLLQPWVAGPFGSSAVAADVEHSAHDLLIRLSDGSSHVRVQHGTNFDEAAAETVYVIDADFFNDQQTEPSHVLERLDFLNKRAHRLFSWCIKPPLHNALEPTPTPDS